jgi:hypothetical protein
MFGIALMELVAEEAGALSADRDAFDGFYEDALPRVYGYFLHRCGGSVPVAEDLTQETFLAAVAELRKGRRIDAPIRWIFGIARHKLLARPGPASTYLPLGPSYLGGSKGQNDPSAAFYREPRPRQRRPGRLAAHLLTRRWPVLDGRGTCREDACALRHLPSNRRERHARIRVLNPGRTGKRGT